MNNILSKGSLIRVISILLIVFCFVGTSAQETVPVKRSSEKVLINGTVYYLHSVQEGQTVYSISRAYAIPQDKLLKANPGARDGIAEGDVLKVPVSEMGEEPIEEEPIEIEISEDKVEIDGKSYFKHKVERGHTLFSIARAYEVSQRDIALANPNVFDGIKVGQVLKIPEEPFEEETLAPAQDDSIIYHIIKERGETLYAIAKQYGVTVEDILEANPEVEYSALQMRQVIKIIKPKSGTAPKDSIDIEEFFYHRVEKRETLYGIANKYKVSEEDIKKVNPSIELDGLKYETIIKIPNPEYKAFMIERAWNDSLTRAKNDSTNMERMLKKYFYSEKKCNKYDYNREKEVFEVALMLPFYAGGTGIDNDNNLSEAERQELTVNKRAFNYFEFYQGVLMALDSLKEKGLKVKFRVYDTNADSVIVKQLLKKPEMEKLDLIFGPVFSRNVKVVAEFAQKHDIPVVAPLSNDTALHNRFDNLLQVNPNYGSGVELISEFLARDTSVSCNYLIMYTTDTTNDPKMFEYAEYYESQLRQLLHMNDTTDSISVSRICLNKVREEIDTVRQLMLDDRENIVVIPSTDEVIVSKVVSVLNLLSMDHYVTVVGYPDYLSFSSLDLEYFHNLNFHHFSPFYLDFTDEHVKTFLKLYRTHFSTDPIRKHYLGFYYALLGYDITEYFMSALMSYGSDFCHCLQYHEANTYLSDYCFEKTHFKKGMCNTSFQFINYVPDISIDVVDKLQFPDWEYMRKLYIYEDDDD